MPPGGGGANSLRGAGGGMRFGVERLAQYGSVKAFQAVIPAQAGIHWALVIAWRWMRCMDSRLRGNGERKVMLLSFNSIGGMSPIRIKHLKIHAQHWV
jgi:hypothetical protein